MNLREVTIGRSNSCDIYLDQSCRYASGMHATIYYDGGQLMYKDMSTNGTMINNVKVHKRAIPIHRGDVILIAGQYPLSWNQIDSFFPYTPPRPIGTLAASPAVQASSLSEALAPTAFGWNWGAFFLPGIWGLFNGCWWLFLLQFVPVPFVIPIVAGLKGSEWSWQNKSWNNVQSYEEAQKSWAIAGFVLFGLGFVSTLLILSSPLILLNL